MHGLRACAIAHIHEQIDIEYLISGNCLILLKNKKNSWGSGGLRPPKDEAF